MSADKKFWHIETKLDSKTACACCDDGDHAIDAHEEEYFTSSDVEAHVAVTEALAFAEQTHEALRRAALHVSSTAAGTHIGEALSLGIKLRESCRRLGDAIADDGVSL